jgi:hypothetical protein
MRFGSSQYESEDADESMHKHLKAVRKAAHEAEEKKGESIHEWRKARKQRDAHKETISNASYNAEIAKHVRSQPQQRRFAKMKLRPKKYPSESTGFAKRDAKEPSWASDDNAVAWSLWG